MPSRQNFLHRLKAFQKKAGLRSWGSHSLRHYFCSALTRGAVNVEAVRTLAGHSSVRTTERYLHATGQDLHDAIGKLDSGSGNRVVTP